MMLHHFTMYKTYVELCSLFKGGNLTQMQSLNICKPDGNVTPHWRLAALPLSLQVDAPMASILKSLCHLILELVTKLSLHTTHQATC